MINLTKRSLSAAVVALACVVLFSGEAFAASGWADPVSVWSPPVAKDHWAVPIGLVSVGSNSFVAGYVRYNPGSSQADVFVRRSVDNGATWAADLQVSTSYADAGHGAMAGYGQFVDVAWPGVTYSRSTDGGQTFSQPATLASSGGAYEVAVAHGPNGLAAIAWTKSIRGGSKLFVAISHNDGATFGPKQLLWTKNYTVSPAVAVGDGIIYVAEGADSGLVKLRRSTDGTTWSAPVSLGVESFPGGKRLSLAAEGNVAYIAYDRRTSEGVFPVYRRTINGGASWSVRHRLADPADTGFTPLIALHDGAVSVAFGRGSIINSQGFTDTFYTGSSDGVTWTPAERISQLPTYYSYAGGIALTDRALVEYAYYNQGSYGPDIYTRTQTPVP